MSVGHLTIFATSCCFSAGVGRTGTFIAIDSLLQSTQKEDTLDVFGFVRQMRTKRNLMVQTEVSFIVKSVKPQVYKGLWAGCPASVAESSVCRLSGPGCAKDYGWVILF